MYTHEQFKGNKISQGLVIKDMLKLLENSDYESQYSCGYSYDGNSKPEITLEYEDKIIKKLVRQLAKHYKII